MRIGGLFAAARAASLALVLAACGEPADFAAVLDHAVAEGFPGVALYVRSGSDTWVGARGFSDVAAKTALTADDRFLLVRADHAIVAAAVLQLVNEGKVKLENAVAQYAGLDVLYGVPDAGRITVQQALLHSSGLRDMYGFAQFQEDLLGRAAEPAHKWLPKEVLGYLGRPGNRPTFAPGQGVRYSPANTTALALAIENATGQALAAALRARVFAPAGMGRTGIAGVEPGALAHGYVALAKVQQDAGVTAAAPRGGELYDLARLDPSWSGAGGGIATTAADLGHFLDALFSGRLVPAAQVTQMGDAKTALTKLETGADVRFGFGLAERVTKDSGAALGTEGAGFGFTTIAYRLPDKDITVVLLANASGPALSLDEAFNAVLRLAKASDKKAFASK